MAARCYLVTGRGKEGISAHRDEGLVSRTDAMGKAHGGQGLGGLRMGWLWWRWLIPPLGEALGGASSGLHRVTGWL